MSEHMKLKSLVSVTLSGIQCLMISPILSIFRCSFVIEHFIVVKMVIFQVLQLFKILLCSILYASILLTFGRWQRKTTLPVHLLPHLTAPIS